MSERRCGPHTKLVENDNLRISQCPCGSYHVTFVRRGFTMQMGEPEARALTEGMNVIVRVADAEARGRALGVPSN